MFVETPIQFYTVTYTIRNQTYVWRNLTRAGVDDMMKLVLREGGTGTSTLQQGWMI